MDYLPTPEEREAIENFDGNFTPIIRELIRHKRLSLSASYQQLGNVLHVSWSTIHKWETGKNKSCHSRHVQIIRGLLKGKYDDKFSGVTPVVTSDNHRIPQRNTLSDAIGILIDNILTITNFTSDNPDLQKKIFDAINEIILQNLKIILGQK